MMIQLKNKNVLVLGLGDTGLSALRWLSNQPKQNQAALLSVADTRAEFNTAALKTELPKVDIYLGEYPVALLKQADLIVISPEIGRAHV